MIAVLRCCLPGALLLGLSLPSDGAAQIRASERGSLSQTIDGTVISLDYARPQVRGRSPIFGGFVHWVVFNVPPQLHTLPPGASSQPQEMQGALEGQNGFSNIGYGGPCPPVGSPHHYVLRVYALDTVLTLPPGATSTQVTRASEDHVVAEGKLVGLYSRGG